MDDPATSPCPPPMAGKVIWATPRLCGRHLQRDEWRYTHLVNRPSSGPRELEAGSKTGAQ